MKTFHPGRNFPFSAFSLFALFSLFSLFCSYTFSQQGVGINVDTVNYTLDIRSTHPDSNAMLQLATPSGEHFMRFFAGRDGDPRPFMLLSNTDTFRLATGGYDYSDFSERMAVLPNGFIGFHPPQLSSITNPFMVFGDIPNIFQLPDQNSPQGGEDYSINTTTGAAQTFTVGADGFLSGIITRMRSINPGQAKFNFFVKENDASGLQLASGSVTAFTTDYQIVPFPIPPIPVTAGQVLFLELQYDADEFGEWNGNSSNPYPGGTAWEYNGTWTQVPGDDLAFETLLEIPTTERVPAITVVNNKATVRLGEVEYPRLAGAPDQILALGFGNTLEWRDPDGGGVFINIGGVVQNSGDHFNDDFVFGDYSPTSMFTNMFFFDKDKGAFRTGRTTDDSWQPGNIGQFSFANGWNTLASGYCSQATGRLTDALGDYSTAMGYNTLTAGNYSFANGLNTNSWGDYSMSFGLSNGSSGIASGTIGEENSASGNHAVAFGYGNNSFGNRSAAFGDQTASDGANSSSFGSQTISRGYAGTVVGMFNDPVALSPQTEIEFDSPLFIVGNGDALNDRSNAMIVRKDGRVGIGINAPEMALHVLGSSHTGSKIESQSSDAYLMLERGSNNWEMRMVSSESYELDWRSNGFSRMTLSEDGRLAVGGEHMATGYHLSVAGKIIAEEVRCQLEDDWPDYVFETSYPLPSLEQLRESIRQNGHLPNIPTAAEIEQDGLDLADMQVRMMEKIEELTLYVIQLHDRITDLEKENEDLRTGSGKPKP